MRKRLLSIAALLVFTSVSVHRADALEVAAGNTRINIAGPKGFCAMDKKNPKDREMLTASQEALQGKLELLAIYTSCDQLASWRAGKIDSPGDSAQYQISLQNKAKQFTAEAIIPALCAEFRKNGAAALKGAQAEMNKRLDSITSAAGKLKVNEQQSYGVLHEDKTACYNGILQKLEIDGKVGTMFIVQAFIVVKGKLLFFNIGNDLEGPATAQRVLEISRSTVAATLAQN